MTFRRLAFAAALTLAGAAQAQDRPTMTIAVPGVHPSLEPIAGNSTDASRVLPNIFDQIVTRNFDEDPEGAELRPAIATAWEQVDPLTWRFTIREGVTFHNGEPLTAEDVAFSIGPERVWGEDALVPIGQRYSDSIVGVEAIDDVTVEVRTDVEDPNLPYRFITPLGYVVPKDYYLEVGPDAFGQNPVGTGPYQVTQFDGTGIVRLEANDDYWGGTPPASEIEFRAVPEYAARIAGMVAGNFQLMAGVPTDEVETVRGYEGLEYVARPIDNYIMLAYNTLELEEYGPNPVADRNLRYAMTSAIDREALVEALWGDDTFAPAPFNFPDWPDYYDPSIEPMFPYDPEAAQRYLEESDYDGGEVVINVTRGAYPNFDLAVEYLAEQWRALGIDARLNVVDSWPLALQHPFGLLNMSMTTSFDGTPTRAIWGFWGPDSARATRENDRSWSPPAEFIEEGQAYLAAVDLDEKREHFRRMVEIWETKQPALMLWRNTANWVIDEDIDWTSINSNWMLLGPGYLSFEAG